VERVLEELVDKHGLRAVVDALAGVCADKAEHVRTNWQDQALARAWDKAGLALTGVVAKLVKRGLP
jgi:hypothetical protein